MSTSFTAHVSPPSSAVVVLHGTQPQQQYQITQEYRDTSIVLMVYQVITRTNNKGFAVYENVPLIELFLPQDSAITPELLQFTPTLRQEFMPDYIRHYLAHTCWTDATQ